MGLYLSFCAVYLPHVLFFSLYLLPPFFSIIYYSIFFLYCFGSQLVQLVLFFQLLLCQVLSCILNLSTSIVSTFSLSRMGSQNLLTPFISLSSAHLCYCHVFLFHLLSLSVHISHCHRYIIQLMKYQIPNMFTTIFALLFILYS